MTLKDPEIVRYTGTGDYYRCDEIERTSPAGFIGIIVQCFDGNKPLPDVEFEHRWPQDGVNTEHFKGVMKDGQPKVEFSIDPHTSQADANGHGPHSVGPYGANGDVVKYMGTIHGGEHVLFRVVYHLIRAPVSQTLEEAVRNQLKDKFHLPVNDQTWLFKKAQEHGFGYPETREEDGKFTFEGKTYLCQEYAKGFEVMEEGKLDTEQGFPK